MAAFCSLYGFERARILPTDQRELIQPSGIGRLCGVAIKLEVHGDAVPGGPSRPIVAVNVVLPPIEGNGDVVELIVPGALRFDGQVVPMIGSGGGAVDAGAGPTVAGFIPDLPNMASTNVALGPEDKGTPADELVDVKLQILGCPGVSQIEIGIVDKVMGGAGGAAQPLPEQDVG